MGLAEVKTNLWRRVGKAIDELVEGRSGSGALPAEHAATLGELTAAVESAIAAAKSVNVTADSLRGQLETASEQTFGVSSWEQILRCSINFVDCCAFNVDPGSVFFFFFYCIGHHSPPLSPPPIILSSHSAVCVS